MSVELQPLGGTSLHVDPRSVGGARSSVRPKRGRRTPGPGGRWSHDARVRARDWAVDDRRMFDGDLVRARRVAAGLTQRGLAQQLNVNRQTVTTWERGIFQPRPRVMVALAAALDLDPLELLGVDPVRPRLAELRRAAGMSLKDLSAAVPMPLPSYWLLEVGTQPRVLPWVVARLAVILSVPDVMIRQAIEQARQERAASPAAKKLRQD